MMLLVTNEIYEQEKLNSLVTDLNVKGVKLTSDLEEAKLVIKNSINNVGLVVVNYVVVDDIRYTLTEMSNLSDFFKGPILAKVEDEKFGMELMKEGLVNDYYVASIDKSLEFERLKKAFRLATLRSRVSTTISDIKDSIATIGKSNLNIELDNENISKESIIDKANKDNIQLNIKIAANNEKIAIAIEKTDKGG